MIQIYGREDCAPCTTIKRYLDNRDIKYKYHLAEGKEYQKLAETYGWMIPLVTDGKTGFVGLHWPELKNMIGE